MQDRNDRHPKAFWYLISFNGVSSFAFGILGSVLTLYAKDQMGLSNQAAVELNSAFLGILFALPIVCGVVSGRYGYLRSMVIGAIVSALAFLILLQHQLIAMYVGVAMFAIATSMYYPSMLVILGNVYAKDDPRRHPAFTISYSFMNAGIFLGVLAGGAIIQAFNYDAGFLLAMVVSILGLLIALMSIKHIECAPGCSIAPYSKAKPLVAILVIAAFLLVITPVGAWLLDHANLNNLILIALVSCVLLWLLYYAFRQQDHNVRNKIIVFVILAVVSIGFWVLYALEPSLLTLFVKTNVRREYFGYTIPPSMFYGLESLFIILLGYPLSLVWLRMAKERREPSLPAKFSMSLFVMGAGFVVLMLSILLFANGELLNPIWVVLCYMLLSTAELLISPVGNAMVGQLAPRQLQGVMMGTWQGMSGLSAALSGFVSMLIIIPKGDKPLSITNRIYAHGFGKLGLATITLGVIALILTPWIKKFLVEK